MGVEKKDWAHKDHFRNLTNCIKAIYVFLENGNTLGEVEAGEVWRMLSEYYYDCRVDENQKERAKQLRDEYVSLGEYDSQEANEKRSLLIRTWNSWIDASTFPFPPKESKP